MKPLTFIPFTYDTIWAGDQIAKARHCSRIGTSFEMSAHPEGSAKVKNRDGQPLFIDYLKGREDEILGPGLTEHELQRGALLAAGVNLSVQVHPDDAYAQAHSHDNGKYESWYIIDAMPGADLVAGTTTADAETIRRALQDGTLDQYLKTYPVKKGDFIDIPCGTLHQLRKGILAYEIGSNSNVTYRFYDYDRLGPDGKKRQLHLKDSFNVADFSNQAHFVPAEHKSRSLSNSPFYEIEEWYVDADRELVCGKTYAMITNVEKDPITVKWQEEGIELDGWSAMLVPYAAGSVIVPAGSHVLVSRPRKEQG
ncbi:class I mannose-6-phosphate isomerase [Catenisphaera adipataccumulans]|jgi:mannose-6-phosphate isomerase|uniref:Mannose-6-phosphate isomerase n=1 Tax=Catenisphaera adipataccumulans TaxID=700500 RepID=A0A7W8FW31_9FIRM|nr:class I mannose-6-phosphate isomerase [Catenisphaera adipataccumulans]MBB5182275.1 mannose-6-phosphate isomerase [Catenisphaera adipataccumulans]